MKENLSVKKLSEYDKKTVEELKALGGVRIPAFKDNVDNYSVSIEDITQGGGGGGGDSWKGWSESHGCAGGSSSVYIGEGNYAGHYRSYLFGTGNASPDAEFDENDDGCVFIMGRANTAYRNYDTVFGYHNFVSGGDNFVRGTNNYVSGTKNVLLGADNSIIDGGIQNYMLIGQNVMNQWAVDYKTTRNILIDNSQIIGPLAKSLRGTEGCVTQNILCDSKIVPNSGTDGDYDKFSDWFLMFTNNTMKDSVLIYDENSGFDNSNFIASNNINQSFINIGSANYMFVDNDIEQQRLDANSLALTADMSEIKKYAAYLNVPYIVNNDIKYTQQMTTSVQQEWPNSGINLFISASTGMTTMFNDNTIKNNECSNNIYIVGTGGYTAQNMFLYNTSLSAKINGLGLNNIVAWKSDINIDEPRGKFIRHDDSFDSDKLFLYQANVKNSKGIISLNYKDSSSVIERSENIVTFGGDNGIHGSFNTQVIGQSNSVAGAGQSTIIGQDNNTNINVWYEDSEYAQEHLDDIIYFSGHLYNTYIFGQGNSITAKINDEERRNAIAHNTIVGEKNHIKCGTNIIQVNNNKIFAAESDFDVNNFSYNTILGFEVDIHNNAPSSGLAFTQNLLYGRANGIKITGDGNFSRNIIFGSPSISFTSDKSADAFTENFIVGMGYNGNEGITANGNFCRNIIMGNSQTANYTESAAFTDNFIIGKGNEIHFIPNEGNSGIMERNVMFGAYNKLHGNLTVSKIIGYNNEISGKDGFVYENNTILGAYNTAASGSDIVILGVHNKASGFESNANGQGLIANESQYVMGRFNEPLPGTNGLSADDIDSGSGALFILGNGRHRDPGFGWPSYNESDIERSNAFIIYADGSVSAAGNISANGVELGRANAWKEWSEELGSTGDDGSVYLGVDNSAFHYNSYLFGMENISPAPEVEDEYDDGFTFAFGLANTAIRNYDMAVGLSSFASGGENIAIGTPQMGEVFTRAVGYKNIGIRSEITGTENVVINSRVSNIPEWHPDETDEVKVNSRNFIFNSNISAYSGIYDSVITNISPSYNSTPIQCGMIARSFINDTRMSATAPDKSSIAGSLVFSMRMKGESEGNAAINLSANQSIVGFGEGPLDSCQINQSILGFNTTGTSANVSNSFVMKSDVSGGINQSIIIGSYAKDINTSIIVANDSSNDFSQRNNVSAVTNSIVIGDLTAFDLQEGTLIGDKNLLRKLAMSDIQGHCNTAFNAGETTYAFTQIYGDENNATGQYLCLTGAHNTISVNAYTKIFGIENTLTGDGARSFNSVIGSYNVLTGTQTYNEVVGCQNVLGDYNNFINVRGTNNVVNNSNNHVNIIGTTNTATEGTSMTQLIGQNNLAVSSQLSIAAGTDNQVHSACAYALGEGLMSYYNQTVVGKYNLPLINDTYERFRFIQNEQQEWVEGPASGVLFVVGNGYFKDCYKTPQGIMNLQGAKIAETSGLPPSDYIKRSNALIVSADGSVSAAGDISANGVKLGPGLTPEQSNLLNTLLEIMATSNQHPNAMIGMTAGNLGWIDLA